MKIILAPVTYRYLEKLTAWGLGQLLACPEPKFFQTANTPDAAIHRARSQVASDFLRTPGYDALMFIDDDIVFTPDAALKLAKHIESGMDVVGGAYVTKSQPPQLACRPFEGQRIEFNSDAKPVEIVYLAGGFTMIHRRVFEKLSEKLPLCFATNKHQKSYWPFYLPFVKAQKTGFFKRNMEELAEDFAFCDRARDAGFKMMLDPSIRLEHIGQYRFTLEDMERLEEPKVTNPNIAVTKVSSYD